MADYNDYPDDLRIYMDTFGENVDDLMRQLRAQEITVKEWRDAFASLLGGFIAIAFIAGSKKPIDQRGEEIIVSQTAAQIDYLDGFENAIRTTLEADGKYSDAWDGRGRMYVTSMVAPYWMGAADGLDLPAYPGDGSSQCGQGDKCSWNITWIDREAGDADAYWTLAVAEHCQTCIERARRWNPLKFRNWELILPDTKEITLKHLPGRHNQKRHGWRYGSLDAARNSMRGASQEDRDEYRKRAGMTGIPRESAGGDYKKAVEKIEKSWDRQTYESAATFSTKTGLPIFKKDGATDYVQFTDAEVDTLRNDGHALMTHNHPSGWTVPNLRDSGYTMGFSKEDFIFTVDSNLKVMRAVSPRFIFEIERNGDSWDVGPLAGGTKAGKAAEAWIYTDSQIRGKFMPQITSGKMTVSDANYRHTNQVMKLLAQRYKFTYRVILRPENFLPGDTAESVLKDLEGDV